MRLHLAWSKEHRKRAPDSQARLAALPACTNNPSATIKRVQSAAFVKKSARAAAFTTYGKEWLTLFTPTYTKPLPQPEAYGHSIDYYQPPDGRIPTYYPTLIHLRLHHPKWPDGKADGQGTAIDSKSDQCLIQAQARRSRRAAAEAVVGLEESLVVAARGIVIPALALSALSVTYILYVLILGRVRAFRSPLQNLPGPKEAHWLRGDFVDVQETDSSRLQEEWVKIYGHVARYHVRFGALRLLTVDPVAVAYILQNSEIFQGSDFLGFVLGDVTSRGLLFVEGSQHRKQRKVMSPAFGPAQVRKFTSLFLEKSLELRDIWADLISKSTRKDEKLGLDTFTWLNKVTLDIIGLAGFDYAFDSLHSPDENQNELYESIRSMLIIEVGFMLLLQLFFPFFRPIPTARSRILNRSLEVVRRVGSQLIQDKKAAVLAEVNLDASGVVEKHDVQGHDLLSLLIKSNLASDIPESMRMSDEEILAQVPTFLIAGHETSSTAIAWTLFALSCHPAVQTTLRAELRTCPTDMPTMDQLNALPYFEGVVREVLRLYAPVSATQRIAMHDAEIPLQKPFRDNHGIMQSSIRISKGDSVSIPIRLLNRSTEIWGEDANEFRPERWESVPEAAHALPSMYGHLLTFIAGAHACIGYRFSVVEIKAILFTLVRAFEFELALPAEDIVRRTSIVGRPVVASNPAAGPQLPLLIRPANLD